MSDWIFIPAGKTHRAEMEKLAGGEWNPEQGRYGLDWKNLRYYGLRVNGYGYNGIYLETYKLPDGRIMLWRTDKYTPGVKYRVFASVADYESWVRKHNEECPEIDPETGRPFAR